MGTPGRDRLDALTGLRFFAALHVVFLHGGLRLLRGAPAWVENVRACGYASVSFFFVLSGFILTYTYVDPARHEPFEVRRFLVARVSRIYPIYLLALLLLSALSLHLFGPPFFTTQVGSGLANLFLAQAWFPSYAMSWNYPGWSISTEAFFYLVFPFVAAGLRRDVRGRTLLLLMALGWLASLAIGSSDALRVPDDGAPTTAAADGYWLNVIDYHPLARLPEFLVGACLGRIFVGDRLAGRRRDGTLLASVGLAGALLLFSQSAGIPESLLRDALPVPFFALLVFGCAHGARGFDRVLGHPALVTLGDASYALYILQLPLAVGVLVAAGRRPIFQDMPGPLFVGYLATLVVVSLVAHRLLERPAQRALRRLLDAPSPP